MSGIFDIETGPESAELLAVAREQLRETPEIRTEGFAKLKELMKQNADLNFPDDEEFLQVVLRCCHWLVLSYIFFSKIFIKFYFRYPESAMKMVRN